MHKIANGKAEGFAPLPKINNRDLSLPMFTFRYVRLIFADFLSNFLLCDTGIMPSLYQTIKKNFVFWRKSSACFPFC